MEYPGNSNKEKEESQKPPVKREVKGKIEQITTGEVIIQKPSIGSRLKNVFFGGDAHSTWSYVAYDVLLPAAKDMIVDAASSGFERMIFGEGTRAPSRRGGRPSSPNGQVSYNRYAPTSTNARYQPEGPRQISRRDRSMHNFDGIVLATRIEAEQVIERLFDLVERYGNATVSDLYDLVGATADFPDEKYGWTDIRGAGATRVRNGYLLDLPKPELLD